MFTENMKSRRKKLSENREVPEPGFFTLVWIVNKEGNTFLPYMRNKFQGNMEIYRLGCEEVIPEVNKKIAKIWSKQQKIDLTYQLFTTVRKVIKFLLIFLFLTLLAVFVANNKQIEQFILIILLLVIWLVCCLLAVYIYKKQFRNYQSEKLITGSVEKILSKFNKQRLFSFGFGLKCDEQATWICLCPVNSQQQSNINLQVDLSVEDKKCSQFSSDLKN